jgi:hypothetical protein
MNKKITSMIAMGLFVGSTAFANTPLLTNTDFSNGFEGWTAGSNKFLGGVWQEFVLAPDAYPYEDRVKPTGDGFTFYSWDDGESDTLENYLFQEFRAGPPGPFGNELFETGDVIVFKGLASATRSGTDTSDMVVRAFIKTLGYVNNIEFQIKEEYSDFQPITSELTPFELTVTFPDLAVDDSLQVLQLGFEITNSYDGAAMDSGTIYFENLEGYIEGGDVPTWAGFNVDENGWANTESWLGWVNASQAPWIQILSLDNYGYIEESGVTDSGSWMYILKK